MRMFTRFFAVWALNSALFLLANNIYPGNYVLGNAVIPPTVAGIFCGFLLTVFMKFSKRFSKKFLKPKYKMFVFYLLANSFAVWLLARLSVVTGFGIPKYYWAIYLGVSASFAQWGLRQVFKFVSLLRD